MKLVGTTGRKCFTFKSGMELSLTVGDVWIVLSDLVAGSDEDVEEASDLLECARKHADFYKKDLYVTRPAIIKFLDAELRMPRRGSTVSCLRFSYLHLVQSRRAYTRMNTHTHASTQLVGWLHH